MKQNAILKYGYKDFRYEKTEYSAPASDELLLKVCGCGICAGDIKSYMASGVFKQNVIPGHEYYGQVVQIGADMAVKTGLSVGDYVTSEQIVPCDECYYCKRGLYWLCEKRRIRGFAKDVAEGGMAEYMLFGPTERIHKLPIDKPDPIWTMVEPLGCALHVVERAAIEFEDTVVIAGMGPIGLCILQAVLLQKPQMVIALDVIPERLAAAEKLGADLCLDPTKVDVVSKIKSITHVGCDKYIEASGSEASVTQGIDMLRKRGTFVQFGIYKKPPHVNMNTVGDVKELTILGSHLSPYTYPTAIRFIADKTIDVRSILTHTFDLKDCSKAIEFAASREQGVLKIALLP